MMHFSKECEPIKNGLNFVSISDGGFSLKLKCGSTVFYFRVRKKLKPKFLFGVI